MEKYFCDFCKNEIPYGHLYEVSLDEPHVVYQETGNGIPGTHSRFDVCKDCFKKIKDAIGIKP